LRDIDNELGQDFSYPSLVRARDGTFYLTYTWHYRSAIKCVHFDANWLGLNPLSLADKTAAEGGNSTASSRSDNCKQRDGGKSQCTTDRTIETRSWLFLCKNKERRYGVFAVS